MPGLYGSTEFGALYQIGLHLWQSRWLKLQAYDQESRIGSSCSWEVEISVIDQYRTCRASYRSNLSRQAKIQVLVLFFRIP